jgi:hypothetical protein
LEFLLQMNRNRSINKMTDVCTYSKGKKKLQQRTAVIAARCMLPSGFFTILMGLISMPLLLLWPFKNSGSSSFRSISNSSWSSWQQQEEEHSTEQFASHSTLVSSKRARKKNSRTCWRAGGNQPGLGEK